MNQPQGFVVKGKESYVCKLKKYLYGLKQAPSAWYLNIPAYFFTLGFDKCYSDTDFYVLQKDNLIIIIALFVDDLLVTGNQMEVILDCISKLKSEYEMTDLGLLHYYLGMQVYQHEDCTYVSQSKYIGDLLKRFNLEKCNPTDIPMSSGIKFETTSESQLADATQYRQLIGSLLYVTITRPDIAFAVNMMARFMQKPYVEHLQATKKILKYLAGTQDLALKFTKLSSIGLVGYSDSDYGGDSIDRKSTTAYVFNIGSAAVAWASKKQPTIALSTTEAEYRAMSCAAQELIWLQTLMKEIGFEQHNSSTILSDNQSAIALARNPVFHQRSKHIEIQAHFIREKVLDDTIQLQYCASSSNLADILTKPLPQEQFFLLRDALGLVKLPTKGE